MPIQVACPGCNTRANLPDTLAGKTVRCNRCSQVFRVPGVAPPGAARPPARGPAAPEGQPARGYGPPRAAFWLGALVGLAVAGVAAVAVVAWGLRDREEPSADAGAPAGDPAANPPPAQPGTPGAGEAPAAVTAAEGGGPVPEDRWAELPLPGKVGDLCVGGSGRYLILHLPAKKQFAVFDAYEARVVKELPAPEGGVKFAAGASKLVAVSALDHTAERWHLGTFEKEATVQLPVSGEVKAVCMGHASEGPLLVHAGGSGGFPVRLFDLATLRPLPSDPRLPSTLAAFESPHYRASADGRAFACWSTGSGSRNSAVFWLEGGRVARSYSTPRPQGGHVEPDSRNRLLLAADGILSGKLRNISWGTDPFFAVPARQGEFFLRCVTPRAMTPTPLGVAEQICVHSAYDEKPLALFPVGGLGLADERYAATDFTADKRFHLIPGASLIALVPDANDRLLLRRFDAAAAAAREGLPRAAVANAPMPAALAGSVYLNRIPLVPGADDFRFALKEGPPGLTIAPDGTVHWPVPSRRFPEKAEVVAALRDPGGRDILHVFSIDVVAAPDPPVATRPPAPREPVPPARPRPVPPAPREPARPAEPPRREQPAAGARVVNLPGTVADVCAGGGGRYLIFHLPKNRQLAVFDAREAKVVKYIPLASDEVLFAASRTKLVVISADRNVAQRWDLASFEKELTAPLPVNGTPKVARMGWATDGPLMLVWAGGGAVPVFGGGMTFLDIRTFREVPVENLGGGRGLFFRWDYPEEYRISANGEVIGHWSPSLSPSGLNTLVVTGNKMRGYSEHTSVASVVPGPDGRVVYTSLGMFTSELKKLGDRTPGDALVPALHGNLYLAVRSLNDRLPLFNRAPEKPLVSVHLQGESRPLAPLGRFDELAPPARDPGLGLMQSPVLPAEKRIFLIPGEKLLVTLPHTADRLYLRRFDLDEVLEQSGIDYLLVTSAPVTEAARGKTYTYRPAVKSKKGGVRLELSSGPEGMTLGKDGVLSWRVPANFNRPRVEVILTVRDASGQEVFHSFPIHVAGVPARAPAPPPPPPDRKSPGKTVPAPKTKGPPPRINLIPPDNGPPRGFPDWKEKLPPPGKGGEKENYAPGRFKPAPGGPPGAGFPVKPRDNVRPPAARADGAPVVRPAAAPPEIRPAPLGGAAATVELPEPAADVCAGGGGRYLIFHLPKNRQLAVFDANEAKVVKYIPLPGDDVLFAAGMSKLIVVLPGRHVLQRWNLTTFEREATARLPLEGAARSVRMGSATEGPLFVGWGQPEGRPGATGLTGIDIETVKEIPLECRGGWFDFSRPYNFEWRVSANGEVFAAWEPVGGSGPRTFVLAGNTLRAHPHQISTAAVLPGPDGRVVYTSRGLFTPQWEKLGDAEPGRTPVPALHGDLYLTVQIPRWSPTDPSPPKPRVGVHLRDQSRALVTLGDLAGLEEHSDGPPKKQVWTPMSAADKRFFLIPRAKLLVVIPPAADCLKLNRFDLDEALEKSGVDYLFVNSRPPAAAERGAAYRYPVETRSKKGGVKVELSAGPAGVRLEGNVLTWQVPADFLGGEADVILTVRDASGQEVLHAFKITVLDPPRRGERELLPMSWLAEPAPAPKAP